MRRWCERGRQWSEGVLVGASGRQALLDEAEHQLLRIQTVLCCFLAEPAFQLGVKINRHGRPFLFERRHPKRAGTIRLVNDSGLEASPRRTAGVRKYSACWRPRHAEFFRTPAGLPRLRANSPSVSGTPALPGTPGLSSKRRPSGLRFAVILGAGAGFEPTTFRL